MQSRTVPHTLSLRRAAVAFALVLLSLASSALHAEEVKTTVRKVPFPAAPEPVRPKKIVLESAFSKWSVKVSWDKANGGENGFEARLVTADVIAGLANRLAKDQQMSEAQAQALYDERRKKYYGEKDLGAFGEKIAFLGHIELNSETYTAGQASAEWLFTLNVDEGKAFLPAKVELGDVKLLKNGSGAKAAASWYRVFTVTFDNQDPVTKRRILTAASHSLSLQVKGTAGEGRVTFAFDPAAH